MRSIKYLSAFLLLITSVFVNAQTTNSYSLKWKLKPNEVLSYKAVMDEIDTVNHKDFSMEGMGKLIGVDSNNVKFEKIMRQLNKEVAHSNNMVVYLKENKRNIIDIEMFAKMDSDKKMMKDTGTLGNVEKGMRAMMNKMMDGVMLRGAIYEDGTIASFYTKNDQKNLIAFLFELPGKEIKMGDTWSISVNFLSMDQNFVCDSSYKKNNVRVINIEKKNSDNIITLQYDLVEYIHGSFNSPFNKQSVPTTMKMTYKGMADFSIEKGRWVNYNGILSMSASGIMTSQTTKRFSLIAE